VERLYADVGAVEAPLEQAPEVLDAVGMNLALDVALGVIDRLMGEVTGQP